jgi:hypothetical protein
MTIKRLATAVAAVLALAASGRAAPPRPAASPVVVELFTSQSCSSCPPADALLAELSRTRPDILALDFHVTYWDRLGWKDPYSLSQATGRQRSYAGHFGSDGVYTPQLVAGGRHQAVGSDRAAVLAAIAAAAADGPAATLRLERTGAGLALEAGAGQGTGQLLLVGFDPAHTTRVAGGENGGRTLTEVNVVRSIIPAGPWRGEAVSLHAAVPAGERTALLLQADDGKVLAAAVLPPG